MLLRLPCFSSAMRSAPESPVAAPVISAHLSGKPLVGFCGRANPGGSRNYSNSQNEFVSLGFLPRKMAALTLEWTVQQKAAPRRLCAGGGERALATWQYLRRCGSPGGPMLENPRCGAQLNEPIPQGQLRTKPIRNWKSRDFVRNRKCRRSEFFASRRESVTNNCRARRSSYGGTSKLLVPRKSHTVKIHRLIRGRRTACQGAGRPINYVFRHFRNDASW
jgi:hypothetical protein